ncbi:MAG: integrase, partial [Betaproteobacteria bacterium]|nr:integrase [Betaproteobacteria bacterium]
QVCDLEWLDAGLRVKIRRSKADQEGKGQAIAILDGVNLRAKAVLQDWLQAAGITEGLVFRSVGKGGKVRQAMTDRAVANIIKERAEAAGLDAAQFSGHSLRSGFLTSAAGAGASAFKMLEVSRHRQIQTLAGYVRQADQFKQHAGAAFM